MLEKAQMQEKPKISIHALLAESDTCIRDTAL